MDIPGHESILWVQMWWLDQRDLHVSNSGVDILAAKPPSGERGQTSKSETNMSSLGLMDSSIGLSWILFINSYWVGLGFGMFWGCSREESFIAEEQRAVPHMSRQNCKLWLHGLWCHEIPFRRDMRPNLHEMHVMRLELHSRCPLSPLMKLFGWPFGQNHCLSLLPDIDVAGFSFLHRIKS